METKIVTREEADVALELLKLYKEQNPETDILMVVNPFDGLEMIKKMDDSEEKLNALNYLCNTIANQFIYEMEFIEAAIEEAIDEAPEEVLDELGWYSVEDVTQDINVGHWA